MRLMSIHMCRPGMKLGKKIYNEEGIILLGEDVELTDSLLKRLIQFGVDYIYIQDPLTEDIRIPSLLSDETRIEATKTVRKQFRQMMGDSNRKRTVNSGTIAKDFRHVMDLLIEDLSQHRTAMIMLADMHITDHYLFQHSLNVCIYSTLLGMAYGYDRENLMTMGLGALLHDIGKTQIDPKVLLKPDKLTKEEFEEIKRHPALGFQMLKDEPNIPLLAAHCALQHHERLDGSGYPRGIAGEDIHDYARWIGLVDVYDAMTTHRVYRQAMLPHHVMDIVYASSNTLFDQEKIALFRDKIAIYPLGVTVTLHTGESGVVVDLNATCPHRPIVRILTDSDGRDLAVPYEIDLSKKLNVLIASVHAAPHLQSV